MDRKKVSSSSIRSVGYDERNRTLEVEFSDGRINQYVGVSARSPPPAYERAVDRQLLSRQPEESFTAKRIKGLILPSGKPLLR